MDGSFAHDTLGLGGYTYVRYVGDRKSLIKGHRLCYKTFRVAYLSPNANLTLI